MGSLQARVEGLENAEILTFRRRGLTNRARYILEYAGEAIASSARASEAVSLLKETGKRFGRRSGTDLKDYVYSPDGSSGRSGREAHASAGHRHGTGYY